MRSTAQRPAKIKLLKEPTSEAWIDQALANLDEVMLDHSHCERKAAGIAIKLMFLYPGDAALVEALIDIAQEELTHFKQVNQWLERRGVPLRSLAAGPYGSKLRKHVRPNDPQRKLDLLLVSALIEARSHERLGLLGQYCPDPELAKFYRSLMASEARHYGAYWVLATNEFGADVVTPRLEELAIAESKILATLHPAPRVHS
ncbi:MAG: tRNA-(ms[2]io[6]A)-hydroxylase [Symploca sp. SIO2G7]|nr:tRNA-(ms[2]io[6]A)-hydroxylase [Symploca sp. SIO2G7]